MSGYNKDYFKILGVNKNASIAEIKKAYHKLALKHHPDKSGEPPEKFQIISEAYNKALLQKKANLGNRGARPSSSAKSSGSNPSNSTQTETPEPQSPQAPTYAFHTLNISLEDHTEIVLVALGIFSFFVIFPIIDHYTKTIFMPFYYIFLFLANLAQIILYIFCIVMDTTIMLLWLCRTIVEIALGID